MSNLNWSRMSRCLCASIKSCSHSDHISLTQIGIKLQKVKNQVCVNAVQSNFPSQSTVFPGVGRVQSSTAGIGSCYGAWFRTVCSGENAV
jgi:hypothetical protein